MGVIPSIYGVSNIGEGHHEGVLPNGNVTLRYGEVKKINKPSGNIKVTTYDVLVQVYSNGGASHVLYYNCTLLDHFGSLADSSDFLLRESEEPGYKVGNGSKVVVLCLDGNVQKGIIIGGVRQFRHMPDGVVRQEVFNGVKETFGEDGGWSIYCDGPTDRLGNLRDDAEPNGASISIKADGSVETSTPSEKCRIALDHPNGSIALDSSDSVEVKSYSIGLQGTTVEVNADSITLDSSSVGVGSNAVEPAVLGAKLVEILSQAFVIIASGMPTSIQGSAVSAAAAQLVTALSTSVRVAD